PHRASRTPRRARLPRSDGARSPGSDAFWRAGEDACRTSSRGRPCARGCVRNDRRRGAARASGSLRGSCSIGYTREAMSGRPFLSIPGPTLVPERITRAMAQPIIDHRGPKFAALVQECLAGLARVFKAERSHIVIYPGSGTGAWEAAIVNTSSPGDRVLAVVNGYFSTGFAKTAAAYGVDVERIDLPYGEGVPVAQVEARLAADD